MSLRVEAKNFRSFQDLDVTIPNALTLLDGDNRDEGGNPNSAGKTNFLDVIFWVRYGWLPKWGGLKGGDADDVIHRPEKKCWGRTTETKANGDVLVIERRRPHKLLCWKNGEAKQWTQAELEKELGCGPLRFLVGCYLAQRRARKSFWSLSDLDRMKFMSVASGQETSLKAHADAKALRDQHKSAVERLTGAEDALKAQQKMLPDTKAQEQSIADLQAQLDEALKAVEWAQETVQLETEGADAELEKAVFDVEQEYSTRREGADYTTNLLLAQIEDLAGQIGQCGGARDLEAETAVTQATTALRNAEHANNLVVEHNRKVDRIERDNEGTQKCLQLHLDNAEKSLSGDCPTCQQPLTEDKRQKNAEFHMNAARQSESSIKEVPARQEPTPTTALQEALTEAQKNLARRQAELSARPKALTQDKALLEGQLRELRQGDERALQDCRSKVAQLRRDHQTRLDTARRKTQDAVAAATGIGNKVQGARECLAAAEAQAAQLQNSLVDTASKLGVARACLDEALDMMELFGPSGWPSVEFEDFVQRVSDRAGDVLSRITRGVYSTRLEQAATDSEGNRKTVLRPVVLLGGQEVPVDDPSGGKEAAIELAYDIAIAEAAGKDLPLILDEALDGMAPVAKENTMELLGEIAQERPVLIIDHATEFRAAFTNVITVVKENGVSRIQ
jgi:hypothetical protein